MDSTGRAREVEVLVSAMDRRELVPATSVDGSDLRGVRTLVINQCTHTSPPEPAATDAGRMLSYAELGLSRSRNRALDAATGDILVLADDDVSFVPDARDVVLRAFEALPDAAIITFQFLDTDSGRLARSYRSTPFKHGVRSIGAVSSIEIALHRERIGDLRFDTSFGLGTAFPSGEEAIFLADALKRGLVAYYWPELLAHHPGSGSTYDRWTPETAATKGAIARRMFPHLWPAVVALLVLTKRPLYAAEMGTARCAGTMLGGGLRLNSARRDDG